jgi:hypothetical protein
MNEEVRVTSSTTCQAGIVILGSCSPSHVLTDAQSRCVSRMTVRVVTM